MKNSGSCSKCQSKRVVKVNDFRSSQINSVKTSIMTLTPICRYVCCSCGYVEEWIENDSELIKIEKLYKQKHGESE